MELEDIIYLSLFYRKKKGLNNFSSQEVISIGYTAYLETEKIYNPNSNAKKTTFFMQMLEWKFREEFRKTCPVKIPRNAWDKGIRAPTLELNSKKHSLSETYKHNFEFDKYSTLINACDKLSERERLIIYHKYELQGKERLTFKALSEKINLSPQRVRIIHNNALTKLKSKLINRK